MEEALHPSREPDTSTRQAAAPSKMAQTLVLFCAGALAGVLATTVYYYLRYDTGTHLAQDVRSIQSSDKFSGNDYELAVEPVDVPTAPVRAQSTQTESAPAARVEPVDAAGSSNAKIDTRPNTQPSAQPPSKTRYALQIASLRDESRAKRLRAELALQGVESKVVRIPLEGIGDRFRVIAGPSPHAEPLRTLKERIETFFPKLEPIVIRAD